MKFVDVILPLPLEGTFTYSLPAELEEQVGVGYRVIVPFGTTKQYSGIVARVHYDVQSNEMKVKPVIDIPETHPVMTPVQLRFWQWLADYYMCSIGDVYKAALPSGLKLASETSVSVQENFDAWNKLSSKEIQVFELIQEGKVKTVRQLQKTLKDSHVFSYIRSLMEKGAVQVKETIDNSFKTLLNSLERTPKRFKLITEYIEQTGVMSALTLDNPKLIKEVSRQKLLEKSGISAAVLLALKAKGIMELYEIETGRLRRSGISVTE